MLSDLTIKRNDRPSYPERVMQHAHKYFGRSGRETLNREMRERLTNPEVTIISQNCVAGVFYHDLGLRFLSPTINLSFDGEDYLRFCGNLSRYLGMDVFEPVEQTLVPYPVGRLGDVEVRFNHYPSLEIAAEKWNERKERIQWDNLVVFASDRDGMGTPERMAQFDRIPYPKVMFTCKPWPEYAWAEYIPHFRGREQVGTLTGIADFRGHRFYEAGNHRVDLVELLNSARQTGK